MFRISHFFFLLLTFLLGLFTLPAYAETRWIPGTQAQEIPCIKADPQRDRIYFGDGATNQIVVINTNTETVVDRIQVFGKPLMLDISKDGNTLAVANGTISLIDLNTYAVRELQLGKMVKDVAFDYAGKLYVTTGDGRGHIYKINSSTGAILRSFGTGQSLSNLVYEGAMVDTDSTGRFLYVGERGLSPASLYKFDISGTTPIFLAEDDHGTIGGNLTDIAIHPGGNTVYLACGAPYEIQEIASATIDKVNSLPTGPYPVGVSLSLDGIYAYAIANTQNLLFKFDLATRALVSKKSLLSAKYNDSPMARGVAVDRSGSKVFVVHGSSYSSTFHAQIQVVTDTRLPDSDNDGIPDVSDNCVELFNADQSDLDRDELGDVCDPYPNDANNIGACIEENDSLLTVVMNLTAERDKLVLDNAKLSDANNALRLLVADGDNDGVYDSFDACPTTSVNIPVDSRGCSLNQFCVGYKRPQECMAADWKNDNPLHANDCFWRSDNCRGKIVKSR